MERNEIYNSLKEVAKHLRIAENELSRPNEDVVTLSVCLASRRSVNTLMETFLKANSAEKFENNSLDELLSQCKKIDKQFETVDLSKVACKEKNTSECDGKYCLSHERVSDCVNVANQLMAIVLNKLSIKESEIQS